MADKVRFLVTSVLDAAALVASSTFTGSAPANLQNNLIRKSYISSGKKSEWVKFDCQNPTTITAVAISAHNLTKNAVVKFQGHATDYWVSPSLNYTFQVATDALGTPIPKLFHCWGTTQSFRWFRLLLQDTGGATNLEVGRIMAGRYVEPQRNMRDGFSIQTVDPSRGVNTAGRQAYYSTRPQYVELTYSVGDAGNQQIDELLAIYNRVGKHTGFVVSLDPDSRPHHNSYYCQFQTDISRRHRLMNQYGLDDITFQEKT